MPGSVVMQVLVGILASRRGHHAWSTDKAVHQKGQLVGIRAEDLQRVVGAGTHLVVIVCRDVHGKQLGLAGLVLCALECVVHQRQHLLDGCKHLVALRFVVLDEVAPQPELVSGLGKGFRAQAEFGLDDGARDIAAVLHWPPQNTPKVRDAFGRAVKHLDHALRHIEVDHLGVLDITHALVVADHQGQERHQHESSIGHVAVKEVQWIGDAHVFGGFVDVVHQGIHCAGEIVGGADLHVRAGGGFSGKVRCRLEVAGAWLGGHFVSHQNVFATAHQVGFPQAQVGITVGLVHRVSPVIGWDPICYLFALSSAGNEGDYKKDLS